MTPNSIVTSPRQLAGVIVTEYGSGHDRGLKRKERAQVLASVVHPQSRDALSAAAELLGR